MVGGSAEGDEGLADLAAIDQALNGLGVGAERATFDPAVVRGLEYYTGAVFEAELLAETVDERGQPVRFGSIGYLVAHARPQHELTAIGQFRTQLTSYH